MATSGTDMNPANSSIPIFKGENYPHWSTLMRILFQSHDLWELVETGYATEGDEAQVKANKKRDSKALFLIVSDVHVSIFPRIAGATITKEAWLILKQEFQGSSKVMAVKLQTLKQEFETLQMKSNETVQAYVTRVVGIVYEMKVYGDPITEKIVVSKILRSLPPKFIHIVAAIGESKYLSTLSMDELSSSLQSHEVRLTKLTECSDMKAFQDRGNISDINRSDKLSHKGRGRGNYRGRGHGRGTDRQQQSNSDSRLNKGSIQCHICKKNMGT